MTLISNKTPTLIFSFVFNKSPRLLPHTAVAFRVGIYHSTVDQIWQSQAWLATTAEVMYILLIYWHDVLDIAK